MHVYFFCIYVYVDVYMYICICICIYVHVYVYVCEYTVYIANTCAGRATGQEGEVELIIMPYDYSTSRCL